MINLVFLLLAAASPTYTIPATILPTHEIRVQVCCSRSFSQSENEARHRKTGASAGKDCPLREDSHYNVVHEQNRSLQLESVTVDKGCAGNGGAS